MKTRSFSVAFLLLVATAIFIAPRVSQAEEAAAWEALRNGEAILMMRHALAPGTGDPANFELGDCSTQRNLNDAGREQARSWKPFLAARGIAAEAWVVIPSAPILLSRRRNSLLLGR
jgi:8-oxo-(d)GTP phosphatase